MRDVHHLHRCRERLDDLAHGIGNASRNPRVDLVEEDRRQLHPLGQQRLHGKHHARELTARGDPLDGLWRHARIGREEVLHLVAARAVEFRTGRQRNLEDRVGHAQSGQRRQNLLCEACGGLFARLVQPLGQRFGLVGSLLQGLLRRGDLLAAVDDRRQLGRTPVPQGDQLRFVRDAVFLLQGDQRIEPRRAFGQPFRVGIHPFARRRRRGVDVLQLFQYGVQAVGEISGRGVVPAQVSEGVFGIFQLGEHPCFVVVEGIAQSGQRLADAVGVFEYRQLLFQLGLLALAQRRGRQFVALEPQPLLVAAAPFGSIAQRRQLAAQFAHPSILCRVLCQQLLVARYGVERRGAELLRREDQVLVL